MSDIEKRYQCVFLNDQEFLLRPEQIFVYFFSVDYIWDREFIHKFAKRMLKTECTRFVFVGFRAALWQSIFQEEENLREDDGLYREPRIFRVIPSINSLIFEMNCHNVTAHSKDIGYLFYDRECVKEDILAGYEKEKTSYQEFLLKNFLPRINKR